nr:hypothetical protein [Candidatus Sigynarchaeota archaeon]
MVFQSTMLIGLWLNIIFYAKLVDVVISITLAMKIKRLSSYILSRLFFLAYTGWSVFIASDAVLFEIAMLSPAFFVMANILRDISIVMICLVPVCFIIGVFVIKEGEEIAIEKKKGRLISLFLMSLIITTGILLNDKIVVYDITVNPIVPFGIDELPPLPGTYLVNFDQSTGFPLVFYLIFVAWYVTGTMLMFSIQHRESGIKKMRARRIMWGILMIPAGIVYFVILGYLFPDTGSLELRGILTVLGHVLWNLSPTLIFLGLRMKEKENDTSNTSNDAPETDPGIF